MFPSIFKVLVLGAVALALPATDSTDTTVIGNGTNIPEFPPSDVLLCTGPFPQTMRGCTNFPVRPSECINLNFFTQNRSFYKAVTGVRAPEGYVCTFHRNLHCNDGPADSVTLTGFVNFESFLVPNGLGDMISFNEQAASYICEPVYV